MRNAGLEEAQAGIKIARRNIKNLRYADYSNHSHFARLLEKGQGNWDSVEHGSDFCSQMIDLIGESWEACCLTARSAALQISKASKNSGELSE